VTRGRAGFGSSTTPHYDKVGKGTRIDGCWSRTRCGASLEEQRGSRMVGMRQQGAWTRWEQAVEHNVEHTAELWKSEPHCIKFLIQAVYKVLPSSPNLFCWGKLESPACPLCLKRGTLEHILSSCSIEPWARDATAHHEGHSPEGHSGHHAVGSANVNVFRPVRKNIAFVRAGEKPTQATSSGLLAAAQDWELKVYLVKQLKFPGNAAAIGQTWC